MTSKHFARRVLLSGVLVLLTVTGHTAAAGSLPDAASLLGVTVLGGAIGWAASGRRRTALELAGILMSGQVLLHVAMVALGHHGVSYLPDQRMLVAHLLAAVVAAVVFARGEQIAAAWARAAARLLGVPILFFPGVSLTSSRDIPHATPTFPRTSFDVHACSRRGPPNRLGALTFA